MKMLLEPRPKGGKKIFFWILLIILLAGAAAAIFLLREKEQPAANLTLNAPSAAETHIPIQQWVTPNGMKVLLVSNHELPLLDLQLIFKAGSAYDGHLPGLAELTSRVLLLGNSQYNADMIAERLDQSGAKLLTQVNRDMFALKFRSITDQRLFQEAFETFLSIIYQPTFPQEMLFREQQNLITKIREETQLPNTLAQNNFFQALYGDHPYAHPVKGTIDSVSKITQQDIFNFAHRYFSTQNAVLAIVGDIDLTQAHALIGQIESVLPKDIPAADPLPEPSLPEQSHLNIRFPSTQTHIIYGTLGMAANDPHYFPLLVGNNILGQPGSLISLLYQQVREENGLAYNISSQFFPLLQKGPFIIYAQTRNESAETATAIMYDVLQNFMINGPTPEQLKAAQSNITGNFALRLNSNQALVEQLGIMGFYNFPDDFLASYRAHVLAVTPEQIRTAFQHFINLNNSILVTIGQPVAAITAESPEIKPTE